MTKQDNLFINRLKSIRYAIAGAILLLKKEKSIQVQFIIALLITAAGFYCNISTTEWIMQIFAIGLVMSIEGINTSLEALSDFVHPEYHKKIGFIKDVAAGAVFIAAVAATIVGLLIYIPKI